MNTPTPETDAAKWTAARYATNDYVQVVDASVAAKLERERDEARRIQKSTEEVWHGAESELTKARDEIEFLKSKECEAAWCERWKLLCSERDQLRKVADAMAKQYRHEMMSMFGHASDCDCSRCEPMVKLYNSLHHVIEKKGKA